MSNKSNGPKVLLADIETAPMLASVWGLWDQNVSLNMIEKDWHLLSWSAKWLGDPPSKIMYMDQRSAKRVEDDSVIVKAIWHLLDECDILVTQNGKAFDSKKLNARFLHHGLQPPSTYKQIDTLLIAKKHFAFTSNKLEYMTAKFCKKYKKLKPSKFPGFEMWKQCLAGNIKAWREMEKYNKYDVLSLEELYTRLIPWDNTVNFNLYSDSEEMVCSCGSKEFRNKGYNYTASGKYARHKCISCGLEVRSAKNLFSKEKRASLKRNCPR